VKKSSVSSQTNGNPHSAGPSIDWNASFCTDSAVAPHGTWVKDFVNGLGRGGNPNAKIRVKI
jgi:hypothetical protein